MCFFFLSISLLLTLNFRPRAFGNYLNVHFNLHIVLRLCQKCNVIFKIVLLEMCCEKPSTTTITQFIDFFSLSRLELPGTAIAHNPCR